LETPVPFPNTEVKLPMLTALVPDKASNNQAVFSIFKIFILKLLKSIMKKISKLETSKKIYDFSENIKDKSTKEIKKIKNLSMNQNIKLKELRKKWCKYCFTPYSGKEKIRIKKGIKTIECANCKKISRWKINKIKIN